MDTMTEPENTEVVASNDADTPVEPVVDSTVSKTEADAEDGDADAEAKKEMMQIIQSSVNASLRSYASLAPRGSRICVVAERVVEDGTTLTFPGTHAIPVPTSTLVGMLKKMSESAGKDYVQWYTRVFGDLECLEPGVSTMFTCGMHAVEMSTYVKRSDKPGECNVKFTRPRTVVATRTIVEGEELVALTSSSSADGYKARCNLQSQHHRAFGSKARRKAKIKARRKAKRDAKRNIVSETVDENE